MNIKLDSKSFDLFMAAGALPERRDLDARQKSARTPAPGSAPRRPSF